MQPKTLQQAMKHFSDEQVCIDTVAALRWPNGPVCPKCGNGEHYYLATQKRWKCKKCSKQFSVKVGTIFEDSPISLDKWLIALWLLVNCKNGVSSYEVARDLGITQKSAWFVMHRLRLALQNGSTLKLGGGEKEIEADESFIGGASRFMHADRRKRMITATGVKDKAAAFGILERGGEVRVFAVPGRRKKALQGHIQEHVQEGSPVYTDAFMSYVGLNKRFQHKIIDHAEKYVEGRVHTNGLENFWSLLKRGLKGTYVSTEPFHLFRYLDEQAWRYNNRGSKDNPVHDGERFLEALSHVPGKRLTFAEVTGKEGKISASF
jgi:transposase-like protein